MPDRGTLVLLRFVTTSPSNLREQTRNWIQLFLPPPLSLCVWHRSTQTAQNHNDSQSQHLYVQSGMQPLRSPTRFTSMAAAFHAEKDRNNEWMSWRVFCLFVIYFRLSRGGGGPDQLAPDKKRNEKREPGASQFTRSR